MKFCPGFLVNFISPCLTSGFTSASAVIIIVAQLKALLGLKFPAHDTFSVLIGIFKNIHNIRWPDACLGLFCMVFLYCFKVNQQNKPVFYKFMVLLNFFSK